MAADTKTSTKTGTGRKGISEGDLAVESSTAETTVAKSLQSHLSDIALNNRFYIINGFYEASEDPLMAALQRYWVKKGNGIQFSKKYIPFSIESIKKDHIATLDIGDRDIPVWGENLQAIPLSLESFSDILDAEITAAAAGTPGFAEGDFFSALDGIQQSSDIVEYELYWFSQYSPIEYPSYHDNKSTPDVDISFVYNYESLNYETLISEESFDETKCLNYYENYSSINSAFNSKGTGGQDKSLTSQTKSRAGSKNFIIDPTRLFSMEARNKSLSSAEKSRLPFYTKIEISGSPIYGSSTDLRKNTRDIIFDSAARDLLFSDIASYCADIISPGASSNYSKKREFTFNNMVASYKNADQTETDLSSEIEGNSIHLIDAREMVNNLIDGITVNTTPPSKEEYKPTRRSLTPSRRSGKTPAIDGKTTESLEDLNQGLKYLTGLDGYKYYYSDLLDNSKARPSTEAIIYRIAKYAANDLSEPIQNIWLPRKDNKKLTYIDFQVKYGKRYTYKIFAYKFVVGTKYSISVSNPTSGAYFGDIINEYEERKDEISVASYSDEKFDPRETPRADRGEQKLIRNNFDDAVSQLVSDLSNIVVTGDRLSEKKETVYTEEGKGRSESTGLRNTIKALAKLLVNVVGLDPLEFTDDALYRIRGDLGRSVGILRGDISIDLPGYDASTTFAGGHNIASALSKYLENNSEDDAGTSYGYAVYSGSGTTGVSDATITDLNAISVKIEDFFTKLLSLINKLIGILESGKGLSNKKSERIAAAKTLRKEILDLFDLEDDMINSILTIYKLDIDSNFVGGTKDISVSSYSTIDLAEIPYYEDSGTILDDPPVFPNVNFITYKGVGNALSLFMNSGIGEILEAPIFIQDEEIDYINTWRESRRYNNVEPVLYKSDELKNMAASFEIYRISSAPKNYDDFKNSLHQIVSEESESPGGRIRLLSSTSYIDKINSNKTYYYMFRIRDKRGAVSNPSPPYSVKLVNDHGLIFPIINQYEFEQEEDKYNTKFKKLLNIVPSISQVTPISQSDYTTAAKSTPLLGQLDKKLFGQTFKIRITSKKTGKQMDLNISFESVLNIPESFPAESSDAEPPDTSEETF
jgi:hypothetical protein